MARVLKATIGLNILIAATPAPKGLLRVQAFTADSNENKEAEFHWTEPFDAHFVARQFLRLFQTSSPAKKAKSHRDRQTAQAA